MGNIDLRLPHEEADDEGSTRRVSSAAVARGMAELHGKHPIERAARQYDNIALKRRSRVRH